MLTCRFAKKDLGEELEKIATREHAKNIASFKIAVNESQALTYKCIESNPTAPSFRFTNLP